MYNDNCFHVCVCFYSLGHKKNVLLNGAALKELQRDNSYVVSLQNENEKMKSLVNQLKDENLNLFIDNGLTIDSTSKYQEEIQSLKLELQVCPVVFHSTRLNLRQRIAKCYIWRLYLRSLISLLQIDSLTSLESLGTFLDLPHFFIVVLTR
jgi:hypothetical protein